MKEDLSLEETAKRAGITEERLRRLEGGEEDLDEELARVFGKILNLDYRLFLA